MNASYASLAILAIAGVLLLNMGNANAAWTPKAEINGGFTGTIYHDETVTFTYTLSIDSISGTSSVEIRSFKMKLGWEDTAVELASRTVIYAIPDSHQFSRTVTVPHEIADGTYSVAIDVTGKANGDWWETSKSWTSEFVVGTRPDLSLDVSANPTNGATPLAVSFSQITSGGTAPYSYQVSYGDGQSGAGLSHTYTTIGSYTATITVTDALGRTAQDACVVSTFTPLSTYAGADSNTGKAPLSVHFTSITSGGSPSYSYLWTFGDGGSSIDPSPTHRYTEPGSYEATLIVTDSQSRQSVYHTTIVVQQGDVGSSMADLSGGGSWMLIVIAIVAAIVIVAAILVVRRKKS